MKSVKEDLHEDSSRHYIEPGVYILHGFYLVRETDVAGWNVSAYIPGSPYLEDLDWRLRYGQPTRSDQLAAAGAIASLAEIMSKPRKQREPWLRLFAQAREHLWKERRQQEKRNASKPSDSIGIEKS